MTSPLGTKWVEITGQELVRVSVSERGHVWGIDAKDKIYHRVNASDCNKLGSSWEKVSGELVQLSVGGAGVWGINKQNRLFYRVGTHGDQFAVKGSDWEEVFGQKLKHVAVACGVVLGLDLDNNLHMRAGISECFPTGQHWQCLDANLQTVDVHHAAVWAIDRDGAARKASLTDANIAGS